MEMGERYRSWREMGRDVGEGWGWGKDGGDGGDG